MAANREWHPGGGSKGYALLGRKQTDHKNVMKNMHICALALAALLLAGTSHAQQASTTTTTRFNGPFTSPSIRDNPGALGHTYLDLNYSWVDFTEDEVEADGFIAGLKGNAPIARGVDAGLGYKYYRENDHRNPFDGTEFDPRYHQLFANGTIYTPTGATKAFLNGSIGYQWSRGDIQRLRTYDDQWVWTGSAGVEIPFGMLTFTPRISFSDTIEDVDLGVWHYGGELHHWFNDRFGGYVDVTYHEPRRSDFRPKSWTYMAGLRLRY